MGCTNSRIQWPTDTSFNTSQLEQLRTLHQYLYEDSSSNMRFRSLFAIPDFPEFGMYIKRFIGSGMWIEFVKRIEILIYGNHCTTPITFDSVTLISHILSNENEEQIVAVLIACIGAPIEVIDFVLPSPRGSLDSLSNHLRRHFPILYTAFQKLIFSKIFGGKLKFHTDISSDSGRVNDCLNVLRLTDYTIYSSTKFHPLYLSHSKLSFHSLISALLSYSGPCILLVETAQNYKLGAFIPISVRNISNSPSSPDIFLFSFAAGFHTFRTFEGYGGKNYINLHIEDDKYTGLGFGGKSSEHARLWLDTQIESKSYVSEFCDTYRPGPLIPQSNGKYWLTITSIQVWGLESSSTPAFTSLKYED